jgi:DNA adenine methylase
MNQSASKQVKSPLRWPGGKSRMLDRIMPLVPPHDIYVEPFAGGLAVLRAKRPCDLEVVNDLNGDLVALYRNIRFHLPAVLDEIRYVLNSRRELFDFLKQPGLTEVQRASRWLVRNKISFSGNGVSFAGSSANHSKENSLVIIGELSKRLDKVVIEELPYEKCIQKYDKPTAFHFIDPPYLDAKPAAYRGWTREEILGLRGQLDTIKGKWMVTIDDSRFNRDTFKDFNIRGYKVRNGCINAAKYGLQKFGELIITKT